MTTNSEKTLLSRFSRGTFADEDDMNRSHGLGQTSSRFPWMTNSTKESFIKISTVVAVIVIALMFLSPFIVHIVQVRLHVLYKLCLLDIDCFFLVHRYSDQQVR